MQKLNAQRRLHAEAREEASACHQPSSKAGRWHPGCTFQGPEQSELRLHSCRQCFWQQHAAKPSASRCWCTATRRALSSPIARPSHRFPTSLWTRLADMPDQPQQSSQAAIA